jgi:hypothetical protein
MKDQGKLGYLMRKIRQDEFRFHDFADPRVVGFVGTFNNLVRGVRVTAIFEAENRINEE